jgi:hypothetical protein
MDYPNGKTGYSKKVEHRSEPAVSLKEVPLKVRRQEAEKPLFLNRYE